MNKTRVENFTDAVVAIILTIMVLEFKVPEKATWTAFSANIPYFFAYVISYLFVGVAWYNNHYMFSLIKKVTKKVFWANIIWLFTMSLLPVTTAWVGRFIFQRAPEYLYIAVFYLWSIAYLVLSKLIHQHLIDIGHLEDAKKVEDMPPYRLIGSWQYTLIFIGMLILIYFLPITAPIATLIQLLAMAIMAKPNNELLEEKN